MKKENENDENKSEEYWVTYSDMFTTLAIVFLVMFVFTIFRLEMNKHHTKNKSKENEKILIGKIPEKIKNKNKKNIENVSSFVQDLEVYQSNLNEKLSEIKKITKKLINIKKM
jgi:hypothetical protein